MIENLYKKIIPSLRRSLVHLLMIHWLIVIVSWESGIEFRSGVEGFNVLAGMVSICLLLWQRDVKLQQTKCIPEILIHNDNLMDVDEDSDEDTDESSAELVDNDPYINDTESDDDDN